MLLTGGNVWLPKKVIPGVNSPINTDIDAVAADQSEQIANRPQRRGRSPFLDDWKCWTISGAFFGQDLGEKNSRLL